MNEPQELLNLVGAFLEATNHHAVKKIMALFNDNAEFEFVGLYRVEGREQIRRERK